MTYLCLSCGDLLYSDAMDCPTCGSVLDQTDRGAQELTWQIDIRFDYSTSKYYPEAVRLLERADAYTTEGEERDAHHHALYEADNVERAVELWDVIKGWTSSTMQIDGLEATKKDLVYHGLGCFRKYLESDEGRRYCFGQDWHEFNFVGCKRLDMSAFDRGDISADLDLRPSWNNLGTFDEEGTWQFDKERLRQRVDESLETNCHCPLLQASRVREALDRIPNRVSPEKSTEWFRNDHIPGIPDHAYHCSDTLDAVVLRVEGFSAMNPYAYDPPVPYQSHREYYIEENLSTGISMEGKSIKDRKLAEMLLEPPMSDDESAADNSRAKHPRSSRATHRSSRRIEKSDIEDRKRYGLWIALTASIILLVAVLMYAAY